MPADRTKGSKRTSRGGKADDAFKASRFEAQFDLKLSPSLDVPHQTIEFTVNITPTTYTDTSPAPNAKRSAAYIFPPKESITLDNPKPRGRKGSGYIPRPPNAFILFRSSFIKSQHVSSEIETNHSTLSKIIGMTWQNLPNEERQAWHAKAKEALEEHKRKWPQYAFRPAVNKDKSQRKKRKARETEPKDLKRCEKIVELLCNGKKGPELNEAVRDFDKSHVQEFVTRFEAPITEHAYRRSSSAPLPDTDYKQAKQSFLTFTSSVLPHRRRSSTAEPELLSPTEERLAESPELVHFDPNYSLSPSMSSPEGFDCSSSQDTLIDFSSYSLGGQGVGDSGDYYPPLYNYDTDSSPSTQCAEFPLDDYSSLACKQSLGKRSLSINTNFVNQWGHCQDLLSPMESIPSSPLYYSASSPLESSVPFDEMYTPVDDSFGYNVLEQGYGYMDPNSACSSSQESMSYYPEYIPEVHKEDCNQYTTYIKPELLTHHLGIDYSNYIYQ